MHKEYLPGIWKYLGSNQAWKTNRSFTPCLVQTDISDLLKYIESPE